MTTIQIEGVDTRAADFRPVTKGWGKIHYLCFAHYIWMVPLLVGGAIAINRYGYVDIPVSVMLPLVVAAFVCWRLAAVCIYGQMMKTTVGLPVFGPADWVLDETGVRVDGPLGQSVWSWGGIQDFREEKDRFVLLLHPFSNPVLPKRCLSAEQQEAVRTLIAAIKARKRLGSGVDYRASSSDKD